jgi:enoyl-CoA hydratase/carnithine racemase
MIESPNVHVTHHQREGGAVAVVTLDREAKLNALDSDIMDQFVAAMDGLARDETLRCLVLTGAGGRAFVAGADIEELAQIVFPAEARSFIGRVHACCDAVRNFPAPVIARINGHALGAGLELAAACDLRIAAEGATFGMPEVRLGIPSVIEAALLPGLIGWGRTREMLLFGETYDAHAAFNMGLVEAVVARDQLDASVEHHIDALFGAGREAVRLQKALIRRWETLPLREAILAGIDVFGHAFTTDEPGETMRAWSKLSAIKPRPTVSVARKGGKQPARGRVGAVKTARGKR